MQTWTLYDDDLYYACYYGNFICIDYMDAMIRWMMIFMHVTLFDDDVLYDNAMINVFDFQFR